MHDILRERLMRKIESLPEEQVYQILDYIEFLESKYGTDGAAETSGLKRFAEAMEDKLRKNAMSPATLREAFQLISAADRVLSNVSSAGKKLMEELTPVADEGRLEAEPADVDESGADVDEPAAVDVDEPAAVDVDEPRTDDDPRTDDEPRTDDDPPAGDAPRRD